MVVVLISLALGLVAFVALGGLVVVAALRQIGGQVSELLEREPRPRASAAEVAPVPGRRVQRSISA